jgi:hypothetical protein
MLRRKFSAKPNQSVLWPVIRPFLMTTVFTAPSASASGESSSKSGRIACLQGCVTFKPSKPIRLAAVSKSGNVSTPSFKSAKSIFL